MKVKKNWYDLVGNKVLSRKRMVPNESILLKKRMKNLKGGGQNKKGLQSKCKGRKRKAKERDSEKKGSIREKKMNDNKREKKY